MPQWDAPIDVTWGKGLLLLTKFPDTKRQCLHLAMQEDMAKFEGSEEGSLAAVGVYHEKAIGTAEASVGKFSAKGSYTATRGFKYYTIQLDVETHVAGISTEMSDVMRLRCRFAGGGRWNASKQGVCCGGCTRRCLKCILCLLLGGMEQDSEGQQHLAFTSFSGLLVRY